MGQDEIKIFLKEYKEQWFTCNEISKALNLQSSAVYSSLKGMRKYNLVNYVEKKKGIVKTCYYYKYRK